MLVVQFGDRTIKGYAQKGQWPPEQPLEDGPKTLSMRLASSDQVEEVPLDGVKAIFRVKSFEGKDYEDLRFHDHVDPLERLWVRVTFDDGEVMEGLTSNNHHHVLDAGFLLSPSDPEGNNYLVYIFKNRVEDFHVLGLRPAPKNFPSQNSLKATSAS